MKSFNKDIIPQTGRPSVGVTGLLLLFLLQCSFVFPQLPSLDKKDFFTADDLINITLVADFRQLLKEKNRDELEVNYQPAMITMAFPGGRSYTEKIEIKPRGKFRRLECYYPPLMLNFKTDGVAALRKMGKMKLVWPCSNREHEQQIVLKEFLIYKMYNLITDVSFRVRMVKLRFHDSSEKINEEEVYGFLIEDVDDLAKRHDAVEINNQVFHTDSTERTQTTLVALFEYMIGNTDWAVPIYQNVKLIRKKDSLLKPLVVPYDFDYCGLVNARYAIPAEELPIKTVTERYYLGFPRTMEELQSAFGLFRKNKNAMDSLVVNCTQLADYEKTSMIRYLDEFFSLIKNESTVRRIFIKNAKRI